MKFKSLQFSDTIDPSITSYVIVGLHFKYSVGILFENMSPSTFLIDFNPLSALGVFGTQKNFKRSDHVQNRTKSSKYRQLSSVEFSSKKNNPFFHLLFQQFF